MEGDLLMDEGRKHQVIFYISGNKIFAYGEDLPAMVQMDVPVDAVRDFDVISPEKFASAVGIFLVTNNIEGGVVTVVFSPEATFEKEFTDETELKDGLSAFLDRVPFEELVSRTYHINKKIKVIAINKEYCTVLKKILNTERFLLYAFVPFTLLQEVIPDLRSRLDLRMILEKIDLAKQYNLFFNEETTNVVPSNSDKSGEKKRLFMLLGIFVILLIGLVLVISLRN